MMNPSILISPAHAPPIILDGNSLMSLLSAAYMSDNPSRTLEVFLANYSVSPDLLTSMVDWMLGPKNWGSMLKRHPLSIIQEDAKLVRRQIAERDMDPESIKARFIFYATTMPHLWAKEEEGGNLKPCLSRQCKPVFFKSFNIRTPFVWMVLNQFGMPLVFSQFKAPTIRANVERREKRGVMMALQVDYPGDTGGAEEYAEIDLLVNLISEEGFHIVRVHQKKELPEFMLLLTTRTKLQYLSCSLIQPMQGTFLYYPVAIHRL